MKKRSFQKIATEIEERVSAAAFREAEKLKQCTQNDEANEISRKTFGVETNVCLANSKMVTNEPEPGSSSKIVGNIIDESGEATETKLQSINGASVTNTRYIHLNFLKHFILCKLAEFFQPYMI